MKLKTKIAILFLLFIGSFDAVIGGQKIDSLISVWQKVQNQRISIQEQDKFALLEEIATSFTFSKPDSAIYYGEQLINISKGKNKNYLNKAYQIISRTNYVKGDYSISYTYATKILTLSKELDDPIGLSMAYNSLGLIYQVQEKLIDAKNSFIMALETSLEINDSLTMTKANLNIGIIYDELNLQDSALIFIDKCIDLARSNNNNFHIAMGFNRKGVIFYNLNKFEKSISNHQSAIEYIAAENTWELCYAYTGLSRAYNAINSYDKSIEIGKKSLEMAIKIGAKWEAQQSSKIISESYKSLNDFKNTYHYYEIFQNYTDSIYNARKEKEINTLHLALTKSENQVLEKENIYQKEMLQQKRIQMIWMGLGLFFLFVLIVVLYISYNKGLEKSKKISEQRDELDKLNKSKDKILSIIAHDMRSPLGNVSDILFLLSEPDSETDKVDFKKHYLDIQHKIATVRETLDNIIVWAVAQFKEAKARPTKVNLKEIIEEQINLCSYNIDRKNIVIEFEANSNIQHIAFIDIEHIRIIIRNILSNAIKYSEIGGKISMVIRNANQEIILDIIDNGTGMEKSLVSQLFSLTGESISGTNNEMGTGLGLSISYEYVKMNDGTITVQSELGTGSTFSIHLNQSE